jgi:hypothetical protein
MAIFSGPDSRLRFWVMGWNPPGEKVG